MEHTAEEKEPFDWEYSPPPGPYDVIRDSLISRWMRSAAFFFTRQLYRRYFNLKVQHRENILDNWPCIITPNHSSHLDASAIFSSLPRNMINRIYTLAAKDYFFGSSLATTSARLMANAIPVDRTGSESRGLRICLKKISGNNSILLFPEGTRSLDGEIGTFHRGAILLSRKTRIPIIPAYIDGTYASLPKANRIPKKHDIVLILGNPERYWEEPFSAMDGDQAAEDLRNKVLFLGKSLKNGG